MHGENGAHSGVEEVARAADRLFYAMRRARAASAGQAAEGLSLAQTTLLAPLTEGDAQETGLPVGRLAAGAEVSVPTATRMLKQLEAKGLVTRQRSPEDERRVVIRLTEEGARRLAAMQRALQERQSRALSHLTPQECRTLAGQLHWLAGVIADSSQDSASHEG
ncbi:MarR family winged helix-turn-helix transcriptional regulator [Streptomyces sioyaensis]|uniref:MarR family winged helix-turn-helix transcriptional regulator n=1 Tax=Streptomyces sioyaensis TaxID=67364 RepID=UPI00371C4B77